MQSRILRPFVIIAAFMLTIGMACAAVSGGDNTPRTESPVQTEAPVASEAPAETEAPVATEAPVSQDFFTEEFDNPLSSDWSALAITDSDGSDPDKVTVEAKDGKLVWTFDTKYVYYYLFYGGHTYDDVRVEVRADNRGKNNNSISLICRYDPAEGWYEFNIANNGLYNILYGVKDKNGKYSYQGITDGGSNSIKQGKAVNEYAIECKGTTLSLFINGDEVKTLTEKKFSLREGQIGMSVSSLNVLPIEIEMDWLKIIQP